MDCFYNPFLTLQQHSAIFDELRDRDEMETWKHSSGKSEWAPPLLDSMEANIYKGHFRALEVSKLTSKL